jgi:hypothetical protein
MDGKHHPHLIQHSSTSSFRSRIRVKPYGDWEEREEVLVLGSVDGVYLWDAGRARQIVERSDVVMALVLWNWDLYDAGWYGRIYRTLDGVFRERGSRIFALAMYKGELVDGGAYATIYRSRDDNPVTEAGCEHIITALRAWKGKLYAGDVDGNVYRIRGWEWERIAEREHPITDLEVYEGELYDACCDLHSWSGEIHRTAYNELIAKRSHRVCGLAVFRGELVDGGTYDRRSHRGVVCNTMNGKSILNFNKPITSLASIPRSALGWF